MLPPAVVVIVGVEINLGNTNSPLPLKSQLLVAPAIPELTLTSPYKLFKCIGLVLLPLAGTITAAVAPCVKSAFSSVMPLKS